MNETSNLCQTLLNGPFDDAMLQAAEDFLDAALAKSLSPGGSAAFGEPWSISVLPEPADDTPRRSMLQTLAPTLLLDGVWLARVAQPAVAHRTAECHLFELYLRLVGLEDSASSPPLRFRANLILAGIHLPSLDNPGFFHDAGLPEFALVLPALHLCLLHRPRRFFPELVGYTLAHTLREPAWWDAVTGAEADGNRELARAALDACPHEDETRIRAGWRLYRSLFETLLREAGIHAARGFTAADAMARIIRNKRTHALGHHGRVTLAGRSLDQWLADSDTDQGPLLDALRNSSLVNPACPASSRLIRAMDFGGPMFGVFDAGERQACLDWIEDPKQMTLVRVVGAITGVAPKLAVALPLPATERRSRRALFTALLRTESPADLPSQAATEIERILRRTRRIMPLQRGYRRFFPYDPAAFHHRIEAIYSREIGRYRPLSAPPRIGNGFCHWAITQMAPAVLVDGCWLAGIANASENLDAISRHLLKIYADELGNGHPDRNHPNVYRRLLESLGIALPPFDTGEFAGDSRFLDAAFDIPVYLLAIGQLPGRYFPELLGLNLAIELSGLGAGYLRMIDILRYHGTDPGIIQLHLSIDNLASGHAARAREAIMLYLDEMRRRGGGEIAQLLWRRIWIGYLSLNNAARGLTMGFVLRYWRERLGRGP